MKREVLREIDDDDEKKFRPLFGNPFVRPDKIALRLNAAAGLNIDEASEDDLGMKRSRQGIKRERSASPQRNITAQKQQKKNCNCTCFKTKYTYRCANY